MKSMTRDHMAWFLVHFENNRPNWPIGQNCAQYRARVERIFHARTSNYKKLVDRQIGIWVSTSMSNWPTKYENQSKKGGKKKRTRLRGKKREVACNLHKWHIKNYQNSFFMLIFGGQCLLFFFFFVQIFFRLTFDARTPHIFTLINNHS